MTLPRKGFPPASIAGMIAEKRRSNRGPMNNFPQFGHIRRADFLLAEGVDHLNHGGYGATPSVVLDATQGWRLQMEGDPSTFFRRDLVGLIAARPTGLPVFWEDGARTGRSSRMRPPGSTRSSPR